MRVPWRRCLSGIIEREFLRFLRQRGRFFASLVRPLVWLVLFAAGLRSLLALPHMPPYPADVSYEDYIDRKSTRLNSSHSGESRMPSSA